MDLRWKRASMTDVCVVRGRNVVERAMVDGLTAASGHNVLGRIMSHNGARYIDPVRDRGR